MCCAFDLTADCRRQRTYHKGQLLHHTVVSSSSSCGGGGDEEGIPNIKWMYHEQQDDRVEQVHDGVAEGEGQGYNDGGHGEPHLGQVHLCITCQHQHYISQAALEWNPGASSMEGT